MKDLLETASELPEHLRRYVVAQRYERYSWEDQSVWRYSLRLLRDFLSVHAHPAYVPGLAKTGIDVEKIPRIEDMNKKLNEFGWRAVPVSGFIPPAAFMELQSLSVLPIASDIRSANHLDYTPAPDIIHEAAGHAPILVDPDFSAYLKDYAQVARRSILHRKDLNQYEAIRILSDLKENPHSTPEEIKAAERRLEEVNRDMEGTVSEAGLLGRMNWWTAEYGLIGDLKSPKIFGAGLLSSVGESRSCLKEHVRKIPLSIDCIDYAYDITEPQPQLFVAETFDQLKTVLEQLAERLSFRRGGLHGLNTAKNAETVNTVQLDSGLQISGVLSNFILHPTDPQKAAYLQFGGECQLAYQDKELPRHSRTYHSAGYGTVIGRPKGARHPLWMWDAEDVKKLGLEVGRRIELDFDSGVIVTGYLKDLVRTDDGKVLVLKLEDALAKFGTQVLFSPEWGTYDLGLGENVPSVFGGPADRESYGEVDTFVAQVIPLKSLTGIAKERSDFYCQIRQWREKLPENPKDVLNAAKVAQSKFPSDWILLVELYEMSAPLDKETAEQLLDSLKKVSENRPHLADFIQDGIRLAQKGM
jgi:phenylalanine-4-hydroxylase